MLNSTVKLKEFYNNNIEHWEKYPRTDVRNQYLDTLNLSTLSLNDEQPLKILDVGCGCGHDAMLLSKNLEGKGITNYKGIGVDFSSKALEKVKTKKLKHWFFLDVDFLEDPSLIVNENKFDIVICSMVVMHYQNLNNVVDMLTSFLKKTGKLLLVTNNPYLISYEYGLSYQKQESYEHAFFLNHNEMEIKTDKYIHSLSAYFDAAKNAGLALETYKEILLYSDDTCMYNKKGNNKLDFPNFIAMLFNNDGKK